MLGVDWANLEVASAFVLGGVLGALATIRILRAVLHEVSPFRRRRDEPDS